MKYARKTVIANKSTAASVPRQAVREQAIPFRVGMPVPNAVTIRAIEDARNGIGLSRSFSSVAE